MNFTGFIEKKVTDERNRKENKYWRMVPKSYMKACLFFTIQYLNQIFEIIENHNERTTFK